MTAEERQRFVTQLITDFCSAKESNCQKPSTWMGLAERYQSIAANMNWAYCIGRAVACPSDG